METNAQFEEIKRMLAEIPDLPGWSVTYDGELEKETSTLLAGEGYRVKKINRKNAIPSYKIKYPLK